MYQNSNVLVTGGQTTYVAGDIVGKTSTGFDRLAKQVAVGALHNSGEISDQPTCHPGTRIAILEHLVAWAAMLNYTYPIVWLKGPAGAGKSAIQRTIAEMLEKEGLLVASFFFFRSANGRNTSERFIATIAYQLALSIPATRPYIEQAIERNPVLFSLSLWNQAQALIISPILVALDNHSLDDVQSPRVIIIDGLDECKDSNRQCDILQVLLRVIRDLPIPFAVLVASRPEHHIRAAFDLGDLNRSSSRYSLDNSYNPDEDIKKYLIDKFDAIRANHPLKSYLPTMPPWPSQVVIDELVTKASGQFIYASTVDKFVSSTRHNPAKRLDIALGLVEAGASKPFEQLDRLYSTILQSLDPADLPEALRVFGILLAPYHNQGYFTPKFLERLLELETGEIQRLFLDLESLLIIGRDEERVCVFHASLSDYFFDKSRSSEFWIDPGLIYAVIAQQWIRHLTKSPEWSNLHSFFLRNYACFSKATPTAGLHEAIEECDLARCDLRVWFTNTGEDGILKHVDFLPVFLLLIRDSTFSDAEELYRIQLEAYKKHVQPILQMYYENSALKNCFIAAIVMEDDYRAGDSSPISSYLVPDTLFDLPEAMGIAECHHGFGLVRRPEFPTTFGERVLLYALKQIMKDVLDDPQSQYFVDGNQYTDIALCIMKSMVDLAGSGTRSVDEELVQLRLLVILPNVLSKSHTRHDLVEFIKEKSELLVQYRAFTPIWDAIMKYISPQTSYKSLRDSLILGKYEAVVLHQAPGSRTTNSLSVASRKSPATSIQSRESDNRVIESPWQIGPKSQREVIWAVWTPPPGIISPSTIQRPNAKLGDQYREGETRASRGTKKNVEFIPAHKCTKLTATSVSRNTRKTLDPSVGSLETLRTEPPQRTPQIAKNIQKLRVWK